MTEKCSLNWYDEKNCKSVNYSFFNTVPHKHSVETREILSYQKIFRQIKSLVIYLVNPLLSRNFCQKCGMTKKFRNFHRVRSLLAWHLFQEKLREIKFTIPINLTVSCFHEIFSKQSKQWNVICPCFLKFPSIIFFLKQFSTSLSILHVQNLSTYLLTV